jgi:hypothetical protein
MYPVSEEYKQMIKEPSRYFYWTGTIVTKDGREYPFTNEDMNSVIETLSATLETYVNLDFRYDHNRGSGKNIALSPINFNLYNHLAYEQVNNFFTYHGIDYDFQD